ANCRCRSIVSPKQLLGQSIAADWTAERRLGVGAQENMPQDLSITQSAGAAMTAVQVQRLSLEKKYAPLNASGISQKRKNGKGKKYALYFSSFIRPSIPRARPRPRLRSWPVRCQGLGKRSRFLSAAKTCKLKDKEKRMRNATRQRLWQGQSGSSKETRQQRLSKQKWHKWHCAQNQNDFEAQSELERIRSFKLLAASNEGTFAASTQTWGSIRCRHKAKGKIMKVPVPLQLQLSLSFHHRQQWKRLYISFKHFLLFALK
ncbi:Hypothetical predicted protein, partial [Drosophila guanche]